MGFLHPEQRAWWTQLGVGKDARGNVKAPAYETSVDGRLRRGRRRRGQSLIVWAINEGRQAARMADRYLQRPRATPPREPVLAGNVHDADEGPEGPPQDADGAVSASGWRRGR